MTQYLISFDEGDMVISDEDLPTVDFEAHQVVQEARDAGVWVVGAGITDHQQGSTVAIDGSIAEIEHSQVKQYLAGFCVIEVSSREEAMKWAAKIAVACRCAQDVREIMFDPMG